MKRICVFCGSSPGARPEYAAAARAMGAAIVARGCGLVYGGGHIGLMGVVADSVLELGGEVIGVIPGHLAELELAHPNATEMHVVASMHERKALMFELSDALVALPGGIGTLEEIVEVLTWAQLGLHGKPCGILNVAGYYDPLIALLDHAREERFVRPEHRAMVQVDDEVDGLLAKFERYVPPPVPKWLDSDET